MKKILGLDLGTNSIGWALIEHVLEESNENILCIDLRILMISQDEKKSNIHHLIRKYLTSS
jgi:CRISPR-associated endonuclease Csn1